MSTPGAGVTAQAISPVRRSVTVAAGAQRAFDVFTASFGHWWPREHRIGSGTLAGVYIDSHVGGRWYERNADGDECEWGRVVHWEPPHRLVLSWQLNGDFVYDADPAHASEVEITFTELDPMRTEVVLEHRHFERAVAGQRLADGVSADGGWGTLIGRFADLVAGREVSGSAYAG